jgi:hypothetical protein
MKSRYQAIDKLWPFGRETRTCPVCSGTGMDPEKVREYMRSHSPDQNPEMLVGCRHCERRGKVIVETKPAARVM